MTARYLAEVLTDTPVLLIPFQDGTLTDVSGNGHSVSSFGSPTLSTDNLLGPWATQDRASLDGTNDVITVPHNAALQPLTATIECWIKGTATFRLLSKEDDQDGFSSRYPRTLVTTMNVQQRHYTTGGGSTSYTADLAKNPLDGTWHHLVVIYDNDDLTGWVDGEQGTTATMSGTAATSTKALSIGAIGSTGGGNINGYLNFSAGEIAWWALYNFKLSVPRQRVHHRVGRDALHYGFVSG